ncbi:helix-turn-helix transcriptional regulator [Actinoplanes sp. CA-252034]|uniref:helix-turn-helix transcriptional regulator n=1 Tax=Actinoplanes sp. CA-252034 TaxID=3239906 RepID=UPI003D965ED5
MIDSEFVGAHELRVLLDGISRQRVYQLTARPDFPEPVADLAQGKVWRTSEVTAWIAQRRRSDEEAPDARPAEQP